MVAGLYPNLVRADPSPKPGAPPRLAYRGPDGKEASCALHPSSVNASRPKLPSRWLVYHEMVKTTSVYIRDATPVTPYQLLLFGGAISVQHSAGTVALDSWAVFAAPPKVAVLFKELRARLDGLLAAKIRDPGLDLTAQGAPVLDAIVSLLTTEPTVLALA